jgi:hypothetical protein
MEINQNRVHGILSIPGFLNKNHFINRLKHFNQNTRNPPSFETKHKHHKNMLTLLLGCVRVSVAGCFKGEMSQNFIYFLLPKSELNVLLSSEGKKNGLMTERSREVW